MSNITSLITAGPDAFTNLYDVKFTLPTKVMGMDDNTRNNIAVRVQDFPFPALTVTPYTVAYKAVVLKRFAPKITGTRKISIPIRIDSDWKLYEYFKKWKGLYANEDTTEINFGSLLSDTAVTTGYYGTIEVVAYMNENNVLASLGESTSTSVKETWVFKQVACINVQEPTFTRESANPIVINVDFTFAEYTPAGE